MMKVNFLILCLAWLCLLPTAKAQPLEFQLQPGAFPVYVNNFPCFQPWAGGNNPTTPEFCDLDGDGDLDYFSGSALNYYWFFQNLGTAAVPAFQYISWVFDSLYPVCPGYANESDLDFADMDGDGDYDALLCNGIIGWARNIGSTTQWQFAPPETLFTSTGDYLSATNMAAADIDGDGDYDLFGGTYYTGQLRFFENVGSAQNPQFTLVTQTWQNVQVSGGKADPCFADLDGDGDLDLLVGSGNGTVAYYRNDGSPTNPQMTLVISNYLNIAVQKDASPELADIDGDGDLDLFVGRSPLFGQTVTQGDVYFWRNDGTARNPNFTFVTSNYLTWDCGSFARPLLADVNGDGLPDLLSRIGSHLLFYRNTGSPGNPQFTYESSNYGGINVTDLKPWLVDINGDGKLDLFAGTSAIPGPPVMQLYINQGTPQNPLWQPAPNPLPTNVFNQTSVNIVPWTADIDADGDQDLFVADDNGYLYFFRNTGTPTNYQFQYVTSNWQGLTNGYPAYRYGCFYDIDGDGDLDLFMNYTAQVLPTIQYFRFYRNVGTPQNPTMVLDTSDLFPELSISNAAPYLLDIDGDGDGDLFVGDSGGGCRFFRNITGESPVPPGPKHPIGPPEQVITVLPNPGNSGATISYSLDHPQKISLDLYNLLGAKVASLASGFQLPGNYSHTWDASTKASGIYILRFSTPDQSLSRKITILK